MKSKTKDNKAKTDFSMVFIGLRIPAALKDRLNALCHQLGMTKQAVITAGLRKIIPILRERAKK